MADLKTLKRWMAFKLTKRPNGTVDKEPLSVYGGFAKSDDPATWGTYNDARQFCLDHPDCQLGFVLGKEVGLVVVDFDKARASREAEWPEWLEKEVEELDSFTEESVSGLGRHVWVWGSIPQNMNRQKLHVEIHDSKKMFCVSNAFAENCDKIQSRDLTNLVSRIEAGQIGPDYRAPIKAFRQDDSKFRDLCAGNWEKHFPSRSEAVGSVLCTMADKHAANAEKMREDFENTKLCELWGDKWTRLGDREIERAIKWWESKHKKGQAFLPLPAFKKPEVKRAARAYVLMPREKYDGWFPTASVSVIGGASGAGKTSIMLAMLDAQRKRDTFLGHQGGGLSVAILYADRMSDDNDETLERLGLLGTPMAIDVLPLCWDGEAVLWVLNYLESLPQVPGVLLIEGGDMLPSDSSDLKTVAVMIRRFQEIASHYGMAIIFSVGAPKSTKEGKHVLLRDRIFGSQIWGRMASTIATMSIPSDDDGTGDKRTMDVQHRNAGSEHFDLQYVNGRLEPRIVAAEDDPVVLWMKQRDDWFSYQDVVQHFKRAGFETKGIKATLTKLRDTKKVEFDNATGHDRWDRSVKFQAQPQPE